MKQCLHKFSFSLIVKIVRFIVEVLEEVFGQPSNSFTYARK